MIDVSSLSGVDVRWYAGERTDRHTSVTAAVRRIHSDHSERVEDIQNAMVLYGGSSQAGYGPGRMSPTSSKYDRLGLNVIRGMIDAVRAEIILTKPRPMFLTSEGDYELQQRAEQCNKYCDGLFYQQRVDALASVVCRDAMTFDAGVAKVFERNGKVAVERVFPGELYVDRSDGCYGDPRSMYQTKYFDRYVLAEWYPEHAEEILAAPTPSGDWSLNYDATSDQILVTEAWHLPSSDDADDGRHVLCLDNATLLDEAWEDATFPFVFLFFSDPVAGFWGQGLARQLKDIQKEIDRLLRNIQEAQALAGTFRIFAPEGSVTASHINNAMGPIVFYRGGTPPQQMTAVAAPREMYEQLDRLYSKAYEIAGVSQMGAQAMKPAGLDSGRALRVYADIQSKRFLQFGRAYEQFHIDLANQMIRLTKRLAKDDASFEVVYRSKTAIQRIKWKDVDIDESEYELQCFPVSALPNTPAGKMQAVQEMVNSGFTDKLGISPDDVLELLDFPDLDATKSLVTAPRKLADQRIYKMLTEGVYLPPEPFFDLALHVRIASLAYQRALLQDAPEEGQDLLRRYITDCQNLLTPPAPPPAPAALQPPDGPLPGMPPPGGPPGPGGPMPMPMPQTPGASPAPPRAWAPATPIAA